MTNLELAVENPITVEKTSYFFSIVVNCREVKLCDFLGCAHGEMDKIYATMQELEKRTGEKFDLLISCGDYQVRDIRVTLGGPCHLKTFMNLQLQKIYISH